METGEGMASGAVGFCAGVGAGCGFVGVCALRSPAAKSRETAGRRIGFARTRTVLREIEKHQAEG